MIKAQTLKGFRDFLPPQALHRKWIVGKIVESFELFGFDPLETPAIEYEEVLMGKYGPEADKLLYRFTDRGERNVALRYDQTVPTARVVSQYPEITKPFRRYQIQPVFRAEKPQKGRYREFLQCDADIFGIASPLADAEIIAVLYHVLKNIGFTSFSIRYNDRALFSTLASGAILVVDKLDKIGKDGVRKELQEKGYDPNILDTIEGNKQTDYLLSVADYAFQLGVSKDSLVFYPTLARGLEYYTSTIFEVLIDGYTAGSVCGGGRYDKLIGLFTGQDVPAVGFAFGFDRLLEATIELNIAPSFQTASTLLVSIFSPQEVSNSLTLATYSRSMGINTEIYPDPNAKMEKQLKYADKKGIPYVAIIGPEEVKNNTVTVKNLKDRSQKNISKEDLAHALQNP